MKNISSILILGGLPYTIQALTTALAVVVPNQLNADENLTFT